MLQSMLAPWRRNKSLTDAYSCTYPFVHFQAVNDGVAAATQEEAIILPPDDAQRSRGRPRNRKHSSGDVTSSGKGPRSKANNWTHLKLPDLVAKLEKTNMHLEASKKGIDKLTKTVSNRGRAVATSKRHLSDLHERLEQAAAPRDRSLVQAEAAVAHAEKWRDEARAELAKAEVKLTREEDLIRRLEYWKSERVRVIARKEEKAYEGAMAGHRRDQKRRQMEASRAAAAIEAQSARLAKRPRNLESKRVTAICQGDIHINL